MKVKVIVVILVIDLLIGGILLITFLSNRIPKVKIVYNDFNVTVNFSYNIFSEDGWCILKEKNEIPSLSDDWVKAISGKCSYTIDNYKKYYLFIKNKYDKISDSMLVSTSVDKITSFKVSKNTYYLPINTSKKIKPKIKYVGKPDLSIKWETSNESVATVSKGIIKTHKKGSATITASTSYNDVLKIKVVVTNLIDKPTLNTNKLSLPCKKYTKKEAELLDKILLDRINEAGYKTRAGVVAALRFLTLEFPYRIDYFFENGRLNNNAGGDYIDAEGRYYHKGLYLSEDKFKDVVKSLSGPVIWGCPLTNWENQYGYVRGRMYPNGLDCSGFISWALLNGGFDVGDTGAGIDYSRNDNLSDLGERLPITYDLMTSGKVKAGDIIAADGHIAMVLGIDDTYIYVAESTVNGRGVNVSTWTLRGSILNTNLLTYVILMDDYYKKDGNYKAMWE